MEVGNFVNFFLPPLPHPCWEFSPKNTMFEFWRLPLEGVGTRAYHRFLFYTYWHKRRHFPYGAAGKFLLHDSLFDCFYQHLADKYQISRLGLFFSWDIWSLVSKIMLLSDFFLAESWPKFFLGTISFCNQFLTKSFSRPTFLTKCM